MCFAHVNLLSRCMPRFFTSFFWGRSTLPIYTVGQAWLRRVRGFALINFNSPFLRPVVYLIAGGLEFHWAISGCSCVAKIAVYRRR
jgi:hypothetical protein